MFFRIYPLDDKGHYRLPIEVECAAESEALAAAAKAADQLGGGFDLWQLTRFLGRFQIDADGRAAPVAPQPNSSNGPA